MNAIQQLSDSNRIVQLQYKNGFARTLCLSPEYEMAYDIANDASGTGYLSTDVLTIKAANKIITEYNKARGI